MSVAAGNMSQLRAERKIQGLCLLCTNCHRIRHHASGTMNMHQFAEF